MRRVISAIAAIFVCGAMDAVAQTAEPHANTPLNQLLMPHVHASPVAAGRQSTPKLDFDATALGSPLLLDKGWRVGITANPEASATDFDDSSWAIRDASATFAEVPDEDRPAGSPDWTDDASHPKGHQRPFVWFRLHLKLAANHGPLVLLIELPPSENTSTGPEMLSAEVFANGRRIRPEGPNGDAPERYQQISRIYDLKLDPAETSLTLAVRTAYFPFGYGAYTSFFANRKFRLGHREEMERTLELWAAHNLFDRVPRLVSAILVMVLALFLLALYFTQRGHPEYLWLALYELVQAPFAFFDLTESTARLDHLWFQAIILQLLVVSAYLYLEFLIAFLSVRRRWYTRLLRFTAPIMCGIGAGMLLIGQSKALDLSFLAIMLCTVVWIIGWLIFIFATLSAPRCGATLKRACCCSLFCWALWPGSRPCSPAA